MKIIENGPDPITPAELAMLQRVFDRECGRRDLDKAGPDAEDMAAAIVQLYENGLREEHLLAARLA